MGPGHASRTVDEIEPTQRGRNISDKLGCTDTVVHAYRLTPGESVRLDPDDESLLVPVTTGSAFQFDDGQRFEFGDIAFVPAGLGKRLTATTESVCFVVATTPERSGDDEPSVHDLGNCDFVIPETSDVAVAWLTASIGCQGMKVNARRLEPGQRVLYHTEGDQEELFIPISGPTALYVDGVRSDTPPGTISRVGPTVPRSAVNTGDTVAVWIMIGAPPTGSETGWDPGATMLDWPEADDQSASDSRPR